MQKNTICIMACLAVVGILAVSIGAIIKVAATTSYALTVAPGNQTGGKMMSGNISGTNATSGIMHVKICTPRYPC
jgi:hypothetical protein